MSFKNLYTRSLYDAEKIQLAEIQEAIANIVPGGGGGTTEKVHILDMDLCGLRNTVYATYASLAAAQADNVPVGKVVRIEGHDYLRQEPETWADSTATVPLTGVVTAVADEGERDALTPVIGDCAQINSSVTLEYWDGSGWYVLTYLPDATPIPVFADMAAARLNSATWMGSYFLVIAESTVYRINDPAWLDLGAPFDYTYTVADDAARDALTPTVGEWCHVTGTGIKYVYSSNGWQDMGTKDWLQPIYELGANEETVLVIRNGRYNVLTTHGNFNDTTKYPAGSTVKVVSTGGPNKLLFDLSRTHTGMLLTHGFDSDSDLPLLNMRGVSLDWAFSFTLTQFETSSPAVWDPEGQFRGSTRDTDGWGNNAQANLSGTVYQRWTLSEDQYKKLTGDSNDGVVNADEFHKHSGVPVQLSTVERNYSTDGMMGFYELNGLEGVVMFNVDDHPIDFFAVTIPDGYQGSCVLTSVGVDAGTLRVQGLLPNLMDASNQKDYAVAKGTSFKLVVSATTWAMIPLGTAV